MDDHRMIGNLDGLFNLAGLACDLNVWRLALMGL